MSAAGLSKIANAGWCRFRRNWNAGREQTGWKRVARLQPCHSGEEWGSKGKEAPNEGPRPLVKAGVETFGCLTRARAEPLAICARDPSRMAETANAGSVHESPARRGAPRKRLKNLTNCKVLHYTLQNDLCWLAGQFLKRIEI